MKRIWTVMGMIAVVVTALLIWTGRAEAAVTVYGDEISNPAAANATSTAGANKAPGDANSSTNGNPSVRIDETGVHIGGPNPVDVQAPSFTRHRNGLDVTGITAILSTFGMPIFIIAIVFYFKHRRNKMAHDTIRAMIDKGMPITPELVRELEHKNPQSTWGWSQGGRLLPGLVLTGVGAALLLNGGSQNRGHWIVLFIGLAFLIVWAVERKGSTNTQLPK